MDGKKNDQRRNIRLGLKGLAKGSVSSNQEFAKSQVFRYVCHVAKPRRGVLPISQPVWMKLETFLSHLTRASMQKLVCARVYRMFHDTWDPLWGILKNWNRMHSHFSHLSIHTIIHSFILARSMRGRFPHKCFRLQARWYWSRGQQLRTLEGPKSRKMGTHSLHLEEA